MEWVSSNKFYDDVVVILAKKEDINPWEMTRRYSFPITWKFQKAINSFKGDVKKLKGDVTWLESWEEQKRIIQKSTKTT